MIPGRCGRAVPRAGGKSFLRSTPALLVAPAQRSNLGVGSGKWSLQLHTGKLTTAEQSASSLCDGILGASIPGAPWVSEGMFGEWVFSRTGTVLQIEELCDGIGRKFD